MLILLSSLANAIVEQAQREHPLECCGVLAASIDSPYATSMIAMRNAAQSATEFRFDASEQLQVWQSMTARDEEPRVLYHSHTDSAAYPSAEDVAGAGEPEAHYLIVSTQQDCEHRLRSFRIQEGRVVEEAIRLVERYDC